MNGVPRRRLSAERARTSLWVWPAVSACLSLVAAELLGRIRPSAGSLLSLLWRGGATSAASVLQGVATSVMTATALTFSVTVVALQLASQQFSPRLLREFGRDPVTKLVLAILSASFVFSMTTLQAVHQEKPVPTVAVFVAFCLGVVSLTAILGFVSHVVKVVRVDTMMLVVHDETTSAIDRFYPAYGDRHVRSPDELVLDESEGVAIASAESGFVQMIDVDALVAVARDHGAVARLEVRPGDHIVKGTPLATVFINAAAEGRSEPDRLLDGIRSSVAIGYERTLDQDASFGLRQLEDIAVKAMSPSVNDPVTAAHAVGHFADLLVRLAACRLGSTLHADQDGAARAIVPDRDFRYYLDLTCGQLRRFAKAEPSVLVALLRMLRDVAVASRDDEQREEVRRAAQQVVDQMAPELLPADADTVRDMHSRVELVLAGDVRSAYADRVGETRSI
jgi:uncharacterized membrane protein